MYFHISTNALAFLPDLVVTIFQLGAQQQEALVIAQNFHYTFTSDPGSGSDSNILVAANKNFHDPATHQYLVTVSMLGANKGNPSESSDDSQSMVFITTSFHYHLMNQMLVPLAECRLVLLDHHKSI